MNKRKAARSPPHSQRTKRKKQQKVQATDQEEKLVSLDECAPAPSVDGTRASVADEEIDPRNSAQGDQDDDVEEDTSHDDVCATCHGNSDSYALFL